MNFLKNTLLGIFFLYAMYWGGMGTQSDSTFAQGMGFVSVVMAVTSLYILYKLLPKILSSLSMWLILAGIMLYSAYCLGFFNGQTINGFMSGKKSVTDSNVGQYSAEDVNFVENGSANAETTESDEETSNLRTAADEENELPIEFGSDYAESDYNIDDDIEETSSELDILREFRTPYVVEAAYDTTTTDADQMRNMEDAEVVSYI
ncbi:MAG: hypothetical protein MJ212_04555, partial [Alphaproteobacteria bacterium]|nr:hypothetical protein [Alphaproteobacteria bacterium]